VTPGRPPAGEGGGHEADSERAEDGSTIHPAGICQGAGLVVIYGNEAFRNLFGQACVGMPAREGMVGLSRDGFAVMDAVLASGRPAARWVKLHGDQWRLICAPQRDPETGEIYRVAFHLRRREEG
jgi:hypothetical protein